MCAAAGMVVALVVEVLALLFVPLQPDTCQPGLGDAPRPMVSPATYCPAAHPAELAGMATGSPPEPLCVRVSG